MNPKGYVVIVEEDPYIRGLLEQWLGEARFEPLKPDMAAARPTLVIADCPEPEACGELIRRLERVYPAPILVLSARFRRGLAGSVEAARRLGVKKVLPKPFTRKELLAAVRATIAE